MKPTKVIALSALCTAVASVCVSIGNSTPLIDYAMFLSASLCVMVPILCGSYKGGAMVCIASSIVGLMMMPNFVVILPYIVFFAPYAVILCICEDKLSKTKGKKIVANIIKGVFFFGVEIVLWKMANFFADFSSANLPVPVLLAMGLVVLFVFDYLMKRVRLQLRYQLWRITKNN